MLKQWLHCILLFHLTLVYTASCIIVIVVDFWTKADPCVEMSFWLFSYNLHYLFLCTCPYASLLDFKIVPDRIRMVLGWFLVLMQLCFGPCITTCRPHNVTIQRPSGSPVPGSGTYYVIQHFTGRGCATYAVIGHSTSWRAGDSQWGDRQHPLIGGEKDRTELCFCKPCRVLSVRRMCCILFPYKIIPTPSKSTT